MPPIKFDRRSWLLGAIALFAGGAGVAIFSGRSHGGSEPGNVLTGIIERIESPRTIRLTLDHSKGSALIEVADQATLSRGYQGVVTSLNAYEGGDEIVVEGQGRGALFAATSVQSMYHPFDGQVLRREGDRISTTDSDFIIVPRTAQLKDDGNSLAKPLAQITTGDQITGLLWREPSKNALVAVQIGIKRAPSK